MNPGKAKWTDDLFVFDNLKFIAIFAICFHHGRTLFTDGAMLFVCDAIVAFALPVFAVTSGYSQKNLKDTSFFKKTLSLFFAVNLLYVPHYLWTAAKMKGALCYALFFTGPSVLLVWYILALLVWKVITPFVVQLRYPLVYAAVFSIGLYSASELLLSENDGYEKYLIVNLLRFLIRSYPFYLLGVIATREQVIQLRRSKLKYLLFAPAGAALYLCGSGVIQNTPTNNSFLQCIYYMIATLVCSSALISIVSGKAYKLITPLGQRTFGIYIFHTYVLRVVVIRLILPVVTRYVTLHNQLAQLCVYLIVVYLVCFVSSRAILMTYFNKLTHWIEMLLFPGAAKINKPSLASSNPQPKNLVVPTQALPQ